MEIFGKQRLLKSAHLVSNDKAPWGFVTHIMIIIIIICEKTKQGYMPYYCQPSSSSRV